jgi:hypothetical protein
MPILTYYAETWRWTKAHNSRLTATEMQFLISMEGKTKRDRIRNKKIKENVQLNSLDNKLTHNRMRWCGHVLRMNEERIPKKVLNMNMTGKHPRGRPRSRKKQQVRKDVTQREGMSWEETEEK